MKEIIKAKQKNRNRNCFPNIVFGTKIINFDLKHFNKLTTKSENKNKK